MRTETKKIEEKIATGAVADLPELMPKLMSNCVMGKLLLTTENYHRRGKMQVPAFTEYKETRLRRCIVKRGNR